MAARWNANDMRCDSVNERPTYVDYTTLLCLPSIYVEYVSVYVHGKDELASL